MKKILTLVLAAALFILPGCKENSESILTGEEASSSPMEIEMAQAETETSDIAEMLEADSLYTYLPSKFTFSSGVGGWMTVIELNDDGSFTGSYYDSDMGVKGEGYPKGTVYKCDFSGKFSAPERLGQFIYSAELEYLNLDGTPGDEYIEDETRYIYSEAYGLDKAGVFIFYLPGCPVEEIDENFLSWVRINSSAVPPGVYGIYNVGGMTGFCGADRDNAWIKEFVYNFGDCRSTLILSYSSVSQLIFLPESGPAVISLSFNWKDDGQESFSAEDFRGTGEYKVDLDIDEDFSSVTVTVESLSGQSLEAWGGTPDGRLCAEYKTEN